MFFHLRRTVRHLQNDWSHPKGRAAIYDRLHMIAWYILVVHIVEFVPTVSYSVSHHISYSLGYIIFLAANIMVATILAAFLGAWSLIDIAIQRQKIS